MATVARDYALSDLLAMTNPKEFMASLLIMQAIFKTGGKQYKVCAGDKLNVEKIGSDVGVSVNFEEVLMVMDDGNVSIGKPYVEGATVEAKIIDQFRGEKVEIVKFKRRKHYRRRQGHRQNYTRIEIMEVRST